MAIQVALNHKTHYRYDRPVQMGPHIVRLRPAPHCRTPILAYSLKVVPANHFLNWQQDPQGNYLARLIFPDSTTEFSVEVDLIAEMAVINPFDFFLEPEVQEYPFTYDAQAARELRPYLETEPAGPLLSAFLAGISRETTATLGFLVSLNQRLQGEIGYVIRLEPGIQTCEETLGLRTGSCRDSAWLLVQIARNLGLAARFVSGYLIQLVADVQALDGPAGTNVDFTALHAWAEVYLPGAGWIGFDPTSGLLAGEGHIPLACTPDASSAAPITGRVSPCEAQLQHQMSVRRIAESPRVSKPYTDRQWSEIEAFDRQLDADLNAPSVSVNGPCVEQFLGDGRYAVTGGGRIVVGGPSDDRLRQSLTGYWHNHPSLTCLLPEVWLAPDLRLGLDDPRPLGMPPHVRMSLAQQVLLRALVAHLRNHPYLREPVEWGAMLHDRFLLPYFVQLDWEDVVADLGQAGYLFRPEWLAPHFEFRFPRIGGVTRHGVELELRHAMAERVQVQVAGMLDSRFVVLCNGRRVPLHATGESGEFVAGVRFEAVHAPLVFDIVDTWSGRSIGGCTYHVQHPGGRNEEEAPVNAYEAESRRLAHFSDLGHTPGPIETPPEERVPRFPLTLDLTRNTGSE